MGTCGSAGLRGRGPGLVCWIGGASPGDRSEVSREPWWLSLARATSVRPGPQHAGSSLRGRRDGSWGARSSRPSRRSRARESLTSPPRLTSTSDDTYVTVREETQEQEPAGGSPCPAPPTRPRAQEKPVREDGGHQGPQAFPTETMRAVSKPALPRALCTPPAPTSSPRQGPWRAGAFSFSVGRSPVALPETSQNVCRCSDRKKPGLKLRSVSRLQGRPPVTSLPCGGM